MIYPVHWKELPPDFKGVVWKGDGDLVQDAPAAFHPDSKISVFRLELPDNDRRQLIEGNPVYLAMCGPVTAFLVSANLAEITEFIRST
jgi:hypothetical protein